MLIIILHKLYRNTITIRKACENLFSSNDYVYRPKSFFLNLSSTITLHSTNNEFSLSASFIQFKMGSWTKYNFVLDIICLYIVINCSNCTFQEVISNNFLASRNFVGIPIWIHSRVEFEIPGSNPRILFWFRFLIVNQAQFQERKCATFWCKA